MKIHQFKPSLELLDLPIEVHAMIAEKDLDAAVQMAMASKVLQNHVFSTVFRPLLAQLNGDPAQLLKLIHNAKNAGRTSFQLFKLSQYLGTQGINKGVSDLLETGILTKREINACSDKLFSFLTQPAVLFYMFCKRGEVFSSCLEGKIDATQLNETAIKAEGKKDSHFEWAPIALRRGNESLVLGLCVEKFFISTPDTDKRLCDFIDIFGDQAWHMKIKADQLKNESSRGYLGSTAYSELEDNTKIFLFLDSFLALTKHEKTVSTFFSETCENKPKWCTIL